MKFAVFALIAALCLTATSANVVPVETYDIEVVEPLGAWRNIMWFFSEVLKSWKTVNCAITVVSDVLGVTQKFVDDVQACPDVVLDPVVGVVKSAKNVIQDVIDIIDISKNTCAPATVGETGWDCFWELLKGFNRLVIDIQRTIKEGENIPPSGPESGECFVDATNELVNYFNNLPQWFVDCSPQLGNKE